MRREALLPILALSLPAVLAPGLRADVLVVDQAGGAGSDFTNLQTAITAAADGDVLLVRDGSYGSFATTEIVAKGITVVADGDGVFVNYQLAGGGAGAAITIKSLAATQQVVLRGLRCNFGVRIEDCAGAVWLDEVVVTGGGSLCPTGIPGARVLNSADVTLTNCSLRGELGNDGWSTSTPPGSGLQAVGSTVQLWNTSLRGGWGNDEYEVFGLIPPQPGAPGLLLEDSVASVYGCTIAGGEGGLDSPVCGGENAVGGPGVRFAGTTSTLRRCDTSIAGGQADLTLLCPGETGPSGPQIDGTGTLVDLPGTAHGLHVTSPVRSGETITFDVSGVAGELPVVFVSTVHETLPLDPFGILLFQLPPIDLFVLPALPAGGQASLAFPAPNLGTLGSARFYAQLLAIAPGPVLQLGAGSTILLLDPSF